MPRVKSKAGPPKTAEPKGPPPPLDCAPVEAVAAWAAEVAADMGYSVRHARRYFRFDLEELAKRSGLSVDELAAIEAGDAFRDVIEKLGRVGAVMRRGVAVKFHHGAGSPVLETKDATSFLPAAIAAAKAKGAPKADYAWLVRLQKFPYQPLTLRFAREFVEKWGFDFDLSKYEAEEAEIAERTGRE